MFDNDKCDRKYKRMTLHILVMNYDFVSKRYDF